MVGITKFSLLASAIFATTSFAAPTTHDPLEGMKEFVERLASPEGKALEADLEEFEKRQGGYFPVTGVRDGYLGVRQEFRSLVAQPDRFNLFLLAILRMQNADQSQQLSYYQVAGIHGYPNIPWDRSPNTGGGVGYCTHSSTLFPTWHRPYMALFEQVWKSNLDAVVQSFPTSTRQRWANAANGMRFPYLDWANVPSGQNVLPQEITNPTVSVTTPSGQQTITNPLFRHCFHPLNSRDLASAPWNQWQCTLRYPTSTAPSATSQNSRAVDAMNAQRQNLRDSTYRLFSRCSDYTLMSNNANGDGNACAGFGLEQIHDIFHYSVGGEPRGHLTYLWWSAFDPAFWLHHMNVERLFSIWQAIHKDSFFNRSWRTGMATFAIRQGQIVDANTPLAPFHSNSAGNYWTSNSVANHRTFGATFPEFVGWDGSSQSMINIVNRLYGNGGTRRKRDASPEAFPQFDISDIIPDVAAADLLTPTGAGKFDWLVNFQVNKFGLNGPFGTYVFFGKPASEDPSTWATASNLIGTYSVLSNPGVASTGADLVYGSVPLTTALVAKIADGTIPDLTPETVTPFLAKNLRWRISGPNGGVAANRVPGFKAKVSHAAVQPAASDSQFPVYSDFMEAVNATAGKLGGIGELVGSLISALNIENDCD